MAYLQSLASAVTNPDRRDYCKPVRDVLDANDGDENGDYSDFWAVRDYLKDLDKVKVSVFITHGIQDENVRADHFSKWWYGLKARNVPRTLWIPGVHRIEVRARRAGDAATTDETPVLIEVPIATHLLKTNGFHGAAGARCGWTRSTAGSTTGSRASRTGS